LVKRPCRKVSAVSRYPNSSLIFGSGIRTVYDKNRLETIEKPNTSSSEYQTLSEIKRNSLLIAGDAGVRVRRNKTKNVTRKTIVTIED